MDVPADTGANNFGAVIEADDYLWVNGQETDGDGCAESDMRFYTTGLVGYYFQSEYDVNDAVNHVGLEGAYIGPPDDLMDDNYDFIPDSVWAFMSLNDFVANVAQINDKRSLLDFGTFDLPVGDTLVIYVVHGSIYQGTDADVATMISDAKAWTLANRADFGIFSCCGAYTGGYPGDCYNNLGDGKRNLADISRLIDRVYISKLPLDCEEDGDIAYVEDPPGVYTRDGKLNLADISRLIDLVYISKLEVAPCQ